MKRYTADIESPLLFEGGDNAVDIAFESKFNKMPRHLNSGDIVLPSSTAIVVKRVEKFDQVNSEVAVVGTVILRVKFTGFEDHEEIVNHLEKDLKVRINESSFSLVGDLGAGVKKT